MADYNIIINDKATVYNSWLEKKTFYVRVEDLLGNFLLFNLFSEKLHLQAPFTLYFSAEPLEIGNKKDSYRCSPKWWQLITENFHQKRLLWYANKNLLTPNRRGKIIRYGFTSDKICKVFELPFQIKSEIKTTMFQYKIIHKILIPAKVSLFKAKICDHDIRPQCLADRHFLDHMFLRCQITLSFRPRLFESRLRLGLHQSRFFPDSSVLEYSD